MLDIRRSSLREVCSLLTDLHCTLEDATSGVYRARGCSQQLETICCHILTPTALPVATTARLYKKVLLESGFERSNQILRATKQAPYVGSVQFRRSNQWLRARRNCTHRVPRMYAKKITCGSKASLNKRGATTQDANDNSSAPAVAETERRPYALRTDRSSISL